MQLSDARPLPRFGKVPDNAYLVSELDVVGRLKVPVGLPGFKNNPGGIRRRWILPCWSVSGFTNFSFTDLDGLITFRLD